MNKHRIDGEIKSSKVKLIQEDQDILFIELSEALKIAKDKQKNLVELSSSNNVSVCKIIDYKKHIYELQKKKKIEQKKVQKINTVKTLVFKSHIEKNDLATKLKNARKFILENKQVKLVLRLLRKDIMKPENIAKGLELLNQSIETLKDIAKITTDERRKAQKERFVILISNSK